MKCNFIVFITLLLPSFFTFICEMISKILFAFKGEFPFGPNQILKY